MAEISPALLVIHDGDVIDGHKIIRANIAEGGTGIICEAKDPQSRRCALKILNRAELLSKFAGKFLQGKKPPEEAAKLAQEHYEKMVQRFKNEYQVLIGLRHPHVAQAYHLGFWQDHFYFTSEFVEGKPVAEFCRLKQPQEMVGLFVQALDGLDFIHKNGLIHLDIKSENVLVTMIDGRPVVKIIDFGLAMTPEEYGGQFFGSIPYIAPEIAFGEREKVDARADLFSFGVLMYHCITWIQFPYPRTDNHDPTVLRRIISTEKLMYLPCSSHRNLKGYRPEYDAFDTIVSRLLEKKPEDRFYSNARAVINALTTRMPDAFRDHPECRASYLSPEQTRLFGNEDAQRKIFMALDELLSGRQPEKTIFSIYGDPGLGKTHMLQAIKGRLSSSIEHVSLHVLSCPTDEDRLKDWSTRLASSIAENTKPVVVLLDDLDAETSVHLEGVIHLLEERRVTPQLFTNTKPILIFLTSALFVPSQGNRASVEEVIQLQPLTLKDIETYLRSTPALKDKPLPPPWIESLYRRTAGIPAEIVSHLHELDSRGLLFGPDGFVTLASTVGVEEEITLSHIPTTTRSRLALEYEQLPPPERAMVELLACWFWSLPPYPIETTSILALTERPGSVQSLHELVARKILLHDQATDQYTFVNTDYLPSTILDHLDIQERQKLHDRLAGYLEEKPTRSAEETRTLVFHRLFGNRPQASLKNAVALVKHLLAYDGRASLAHRILKKMKEVGPRNPKFHIYLSCLEIDCLFDSGKLHEALETAQKTLALLENLNNGKTSWRFELLLRTLSLHLRLQRRPAIEATLRLCRELATRMPPNVYHVLLHFYSAHDLYLQSLEDIPHSRDLLEHARRECEEGGRLLATMPTMRDFAMRSNPAGLILRACGDIEAACQKFEERLQASRKDILKTVATLVSLAETHRLAGHYPQARACAERLLDVAQRIHQPQWLLPAHEVMAKVFHDTDCFKEALREANAALAASMMFLHNAKSALSEAQLAVLMGHCHKELKSWSAASACFETAISKGVQGPHLMSAYIGLAEVEIQQGHLDEGGKHLDQAEWIVHKLPEGVTRPYLHRLEELKQQLRNHS